VKPKRNLEEMVGLLRDWYRNHGRVPGYIEMMKILGYRSSRSVHDAVTRMEAAGYIRKVKGRISIPKADGIQLRGVVPAGFPSPSEDELQDTIDLNGYLVEKPAATFMVKVSGDSMIDAGIMPDDIVFVEQGRSPKSGDIVVARVDGEGTIKYFHKDKDGVRLEPANKKYTAIRPKERFEILGVVRSVARKYR
jgi:SOS regulatory protein LexA